ncbi:hypothetical protein D1631_06260 [Chryseobacterium nematophagum]|uniref:C1q domain-containing protein n=1 Tax=Chryseobacterium nematophagum TaxID=2305228 RepID=A0A3M7TH81_9FLAO|nr:hypothetical protein [Chryseobacterium nematophagum]RNA61560.1 hypothetical protein D1631_06260 [Chryseobacterium nematophagum]
MKKIITPFILCTYSLFFSQVGINTTTPTATLDVNGNVKIRTVPTASSLASFKLIGVDTGTSEIQQTNLNTLTDSFVNTSMYAAKKSTGISLLTLGIFPSGFRAVNFLESERITGTTTGLFSDTDNTYVIPSAGTYAVGFTFRYGSGVQASILSNTPGVGIIRNRGGVATLIDSRSFSGANLILLSLTISESSLNSIYTFQAGDRISFGLTGSSALDIGLLGASVASFYIYKISN